MEYSADSSRAALLLTNRLVELDAKPMTAREFWSLVGRVDPADLLHQDPDGIAALANVGADQAQRIRTLLDATTPLGVEEERLADGGVQLVSALDSTFPAAMRRRLGTACPPFLLVAGPIDWLQTPGLGIVGSRATTERIVDTARRAAQVAVSAGWPIISGLARGVDQVAMAGALEVGGEVVGVPAEGVLRAARNDEIRARVHGGEMCIASPYAPSAPFSAGNAMGRNKLIYALSRLTLVVAADNGTGGTWAGAKEALDRRFAHVAVWQGDGAKDGNDALVRRGATAVTDLNQLASLDIEPLAPPLQSSLF